MAERPDVVVIGAGIVGVAAALHLQMRGKKVLLLDRREPGRETSYGNAGIIGNIYVLPFGFPSLTRIPSILMDRDVGARIHLASLPAYLPWLAGFYLESRLKPRLENARRLWPLHATSIEEHRTLMQGTEAGRHVFPAGRVSLYRSEESFAADVLERDTARDFGVPFEVMETEAFQALEPHVKPVYRKAVRWPSGARINNPGAMVTEYAQRFVRDGGVFLQSECRGMEYKGDVWNVKTTQGDVQVSNVVLCAGPWAAEILKPLGYNFPLGFKRGYHRHYGAANGATLSHAIVDVDVGYLLTPMEQGIRLVTGAEFAGLHAPPTPVQIDRALPHARGLFPLGDPLDAPWLGSRPCFTDSLPVVGPAPRHKGLWINFGQGHLGMTTGPSCGRLLAEMMTGAQPFCDPAPYRATRFSC